MKSSHIIYWFSKQRMITHLTQMEDANKGFKPLVQVTYKSQVRNVSDKSKFLAQAGFTQANPDALEAAIRQMIATHEATFDSHNSYGDFYRVEGTLKGINDHDLLVVTIWIMRSEENGLYRFVTLKPWRKVDDAT